MADKPRKRLSKKSRPITTLPAEGPYRAITRALTRAEATLWALYGEIRELAEALRDAREAFNKAQAEKGGP
jgi:hypothetical protein